MKKDSQRGWIKWMVFGIVLVVFIGLRTFQLQNSFWFFGDLGRDLFVLQEWSANIFHPPLLGPQTSVVSFNQSAWYFYYLFPFFLLSGHSVYSTLMATLTLYVAMMIGAFVVFKKKKHWLPTAALLYLIVIHPQFVLQHRFIWNPSLITPFLLMGFWAWWRYQSSKNWRLLVVLTLSLAIAAGLNFSLVPTVAVMAGLFLWEQRQNKQGIWQFVGLGLAANLLVHLPTILFELRHNFLLARNLPTNELQQVESVLSQKLAQLADTLVLPSLPVQWSLTLGAAIVLLLLLVAFRSNKLRANWIFIRSLQITFFTAGLMLLTPFRMHAHFIFGVLTFLLVALARLPRKILLPVLAVLSAFYLQPYYLQLYAQRAPHTVGEQRQCMQQTCEAIKQAGLEPIFVNTQTTSYNHQAREYTFWLRESGCQAIEAQGFLVTPTQYMTVVADRAEFTNGSTDYYELSQFGPAEELQAIECQPDLKIYLLEKN